MKKVFLMAAMLMLCGCISPRRGVVLVTGLPKPDSEVTGANLYMADSPEAEFVRINLKPITFDSYLVEGVEPGKNFYFKFTQLTGTGKAAVESRQSPPFPRKSVERERYESGAPAPKNGFIVAKGWPELMGDTAGFNLYITDIPGRGYRKANSQPITSSQYLVQDLEEDKVYFFVITRLSSDNPPKESKPSTEWSQKALDKAWATPPEGLK